MWKEAFVPKYSSIRTVMSVQYTRVTDRRRTDGQITTPYTALGQRRAVKAKFHDTGPTGPARTRVDFFARPGPQTRVSDKARGLCLVGSGRARVVEFSYNNATKKLSYRRGTARYVVSIEILPTATQQCRNYLYDKS